MVGEGGVFGAGADFDFVFAGGQGDVGPEEDAVGGVAGGGDGFAVDE